MEKKFNYFYRIENLINGKFYFGVHQTDILEDGYMGSGKRMKYAIQKYGIQNFKKEILEFFDKYQEALDYEAEVVNEDLVLDPNCYNLKKGGRGGFGNNGKGEEWYKNHIQNMLKKQWSNPEFIEKHKKRCGYNFNINGNKSSRFIGKKHSQESKEKMRSHKGKQQGEKNSQFGTCWITNEKQNLKIHQGDLIPDGWRLGRNMRGRAVGSSLGS